MGAAGRKPEAFFFRSAQKILRILVDFFLMTLYNKRI